MSERDPVLDALDELAAALEDAWRRYVAGDEHALESTALRATYAHALEVLPALDGGIRSEVLGRVELYRRHRRAELAPDPRHGEPVGLGEVAGLTVAFKALVHRAGGFVRFGNAELEQAATLHAKVDADASYMTVELVDGAPPDVPRFASDAELAAEPLTPADRDEFAHGLGEVDGGESA